MGLAGMRTQVSCPLLRFPPCSGPKRNIRDKAPEPQHTELRGGLQNHLTQGFLTGGVSEPPYACLSLPLKSDRSVVGTTGSKQSPGG